MAKSLACFEGVSVTKDGIGLPERTAGLATVAALWKGGWASLKL
jgi:hypothetical protein